eukprot:Skav231900  [mRNA]  locus=scaffold960:181728:183799:- [translate_table: standard]
MSLAEVPRNFSAIARNLPFALLEKAATASQDELFQSDSPQETDQVFGVQLPGAGLALQDLWLVNGAEQPTLTVKTTEWHRLRLVMAGVSTWLYLSFGDCEGGPRLFSVGPAGRQLVVAGSSWLVKRLQVALLAKDGIYVDDFPRWIQHVSLPPGGRSELVLRCPGPKEHQVMSSASPGQGGARLGLGEVPGLNSLGGNR